MKQLRTILYLSAVAYAERLDAVALQAYKDGRRDRDRLFAAAAARFSARLPAWWQWTAYLAFAVLEGVTT